MIGQRPFYCRTEPLLHLGRSSFFVAIQGLQRCLRFDLQQRRYRNMAILETCASLARPNSYRQSKIHPAKSYVNKQQSEGPSRRHNRVDQSGRSPRSAKRKDICDPCISTAIGRTNSLRYSPSRDFSEAKVQQAQPHINHEQQSENAAGRHSRVDHRGVTTAARKHIWHSRTSTAINRATARLAQPTMTCVCPHCGITNRQRENTTSPVVYQLRSAKQKHYWATSRCRAGRYINRDESISGTAAYQQCGVSTAISQAKAYRRSYISTAVRTPKRQHCWTTQS